MALRIAVRLTPKGGRDAVEGWTVAADGMRCLKARVRAVPEDGKANAALVELLAKTLALAKSQVKIVAGSASRRKTVEIAGDGPKLKAMLDSLGDAT
jgi:uncharacterized protein